MDYCGLEQIQASQQQENELNNRFIISAADLWGEKRALRELRGVQGGRVESKEEERRKDEGEDDTRQSCYLSFYSHLPAEGPEQRRRAGQERAWIPVCVSHLASGSNEVLSCQTGPGSVAQAYPWPPLQHLWDNSQALTNVTFYKVQMYLALLPENKFSSSVSWLQRPWNTFY